jgi:hypothetical protein
VPTVLHLVVYGAHVRPFSNLVTSFSCPLPFVSSSAGTLCPCSHARTHDVNARPPEAVGRQPESSWNRNLLVFSLPSGITQAPHHMRLLVRGHSPTSLTITPAASALPPPLPAGTVLAEACAAHPPPPRQQQPSSIHRRHSSSSSNGWPCPLLGCRGSPSPQQQHATSALAGMGVDTHSSGLLGSGGG